MSRRSIPDLLPGTLDMLILRTLQSQPHHGWAIAERIQQISDDVLQVNQGSLYPALHRLEHQGWIEAEWAVSELGRRAKYLPPHGLRAAAARGRGRRVGTDVRRHRASDEAGMTLRRLKLLTQAVFARRRVERDLDDELAFHIERETQKHIASGVSPAEARTRAMARFGSVTVAADECRDARGTTLVDGIVRDLWYAFRSFRHAPLVAVTIVATVGLGLGLVTVVFTLLNAAVFRTDDVRDPHELFSVERQLPANAKPEPFTRPQYEALRRETGVFSDAFVMGPEMDWWIDGRRMEGALVAGNFFHVLGAGAARGRTLVPSDDELGGRHAIVLSHRAWSRYFERDPGVLDRPVQLNGVPFQVVGVMPEGFRGLSIAAPDFWAPLSLLGEFRPSDRGRDGTVGLSIVGPAEARTVARPGARGTPGVGLAALPRATSGGPPRNSSWNRGRAPFRSRPRRCWSSCRCSSRSA